MSVRDRRSNMVDSSINAPAKKDGGGGQFTWGSAVNDPVEVYRTQEVGPSVTLAPAVQQTVIVQDAFAGNLADNRQFPTLSGVIYAQPANAGAVQVPTLAPGARAWPAASAPKVVLSADSLRPGTADLFDSSHPRNAFASRASTSTTVTSVVGPQMAIDWSGGGIPAEAKPLTLANNPAHLSMYQAPPQARSVPANVLRSQVQQRVQAPVQRGYVQQAPAVQRSFQRSFAQGSRGQR